MTKSLLLAAFIGCALLAGGAAIAAADQSAETMDQAAKQACGACHGQCRQNAIACREKACTDAGGGPAAGACDSAEDDPQRLVAVKKCDSAVAVCDKRCAATLLCQMAQ